MTLAGALQWAVLALCALMLLTHGALATGWWCAPAALTGAPAPIPSPPPGTPRCR